MSSSGWAGEPENSKQELIALDQLQSFAPEHRMDWPNGGCEGNRTGGGVGGGAREQSGTLEKKDSGSRVGGEWLDKGRLLIEENSSDRNDGGGAGAGGGGGRSRRRRHSEKSPRFPRVKRGGLVKQMSEDISGGGGGHVNPYFDSESELGLLVSDRSPIAPAECGSRRSMSEDQRTIAAASLRLPPSFSSRRTTTADGDRQQRPDPAAAAAATSSGGVVGDGESLGVDSKDGGATVVTAGVDVSLGGVGELREYSPSPGAGDTQPLLLDEGASESSLRIIGEIVLPFLLAGFGCVFAGLVLDLVKVMTSTD